MVVRSASRVCVALRLGMTGLVSLCLACQGCAVESKPLPDTPESSTPSTPEDTADTTVPEPDTADSGSPVDTADTGTPTPPWDDGPPPVVVLFIGDGMGLEHLRGAGLVGHGAEGSLFIESAPHQGRIQTASLSGYTDSAASATTMASGQKTYNGRIGVDSHGDNLEGLVDIAHLRGLSVGVVTTDTLTGATPSAFLTHSSSRYDTDTIADGLVAEPPEVLLGGGADALLEGFSEGGVTVVQTAADLSAAPVDLTRPLVGLFAADELPFLVDMAEDDPTPRLPALVSTALDHLLTDPDGTLLIVEGARIDHASHQNRTSAVFPEVLELDEAVRTVVERVSLLEDREVTVLVTADHECGGLTITRPELDAETGLPGVSWIWTDHTNRDVGVFGWGDAAAALAGHRQHNDHIWSTLDGALRSRRSTPPTLPRLPDGMLDDLGAPVVSQTTDTDFGSGYNQLDGLRVATDRRGIWVGIDGIFDERANAVVVWLDLDHGASTGLGAGMELTDLDGALDRLLGVPTIVTELSGLGFDAAAAQIGASYARTTGTRESAGVRQFWPPAGSTDNLAWLAGAVNYDDGNIADGAPAADAAGTGASVNGMEVLFLFDELFEDGLPAEGADLALMVTLSSASGATWSNQALPPQDVRGADGSLVVSRVVTFSVDSDGALIAGPVVEP